MEFPSYIISADVARGDGSDFSAFHVIDVEACEQVAEYKSQIGTREYGNMLVSVASEYNNALIVPENANVGWDVINTIIEKGYQNLHYSPRAYGEMQMDKWMAKMESDQTVSAIDNGHRTGEARVDSYDAGHLTASSMALLSTCNRAEISALAASSKRMTVE